MILEIKSIERGERKTKSGMQSGINFVGIKFQTDRDTGKLFSTDEEWSRFFSDAFNSNIIGVIEQVGVDGMLDLKMEQDKKNAKWWNPVSASEYKEGSSKKATKVNLVPTAAKTEQKAQTAPVDQDYIRSGALDAALNLVETAVNLNAQDKMTIFPKGKVTIDLLAQEVLGVADLFEKYLRREATGTPKSDAKAVTVGATEKLDQQEAADVPF